MSKRMFNYLVASLIVVLVMSLLFTFVACSSHQKRVDTISNVMDTTQKVYLEVEGVLNSLHESDKITGATWNSIDDKLDQTDVIMIRLLKNWKLVPQTDAAVENFIRTQDFQDALVLIFQLLKIADRNDLEIKLQPFVRS